jgi:hypothetical protein
MPVKEETKERKRMVVEEVKADEPLKNEEMQEVEKVEQTKPLEPDILEEGVKDVISQKPETIVVETPIETPIEPKKSSSIALWIIIPGIFLLGAILGGILFYQKGVETNKEQAPSATFSPAPTVIPSASPSASLDLTKYTVTIFNGSGISGEAGRAKTLLTTAKFTVGTTANAATYDYTKTIIKAKSSVDSAFVTALSEALGKTYIVDTAQTLSTSSADAVQVIIGSSKAE